MQGLRYSGKDNVRDRKQSGNPAPEAGHPGGAAGQGGGRHATDHLRHGSRKLHPQYSGGAAAGQSPGDHCRRSVLASRKRPRGGSAHRASASSRWNLRSRPAAGTTRGAVPRGQAPDGLRAVADAVVFPGQRRRGRRQAARRQDQRAGVRRRGGFPQPHFDRRMRSRHLGAGAARASRRSRAGAGASQQLAGAGAAERRQRSRGRDAFARRSQRRIESARDRTNVFQERRRRDFVRGLGRGHRHRAPGIRREFAASRIWPAATSPS